MKRSGRSARALYRELVRSGREMARSPLEYLEPRLLLSVTPGMMTLNADGTSTTLTANQTVNVMAGFALHVRAVDSVDTSYNATGPTVFTSPSNPSNTEFLWNFGDTASGGDADYAAGVRNAHNAEVGFNVAHIYDTPGTYPLTLTTTDTTGVVTQFMVNVAVTNTAVGASQSDVETVGANMYYIDSVNGSDTGNGHGPVNDGTNAPVKTYAEALTLIRALGSPSDIQIRFKRGETFNVMSTDYGSSTGLAATNVLIGAYGSTLLAKPLLENGDGLAAGLIRCGSGAENWTVQDLTLGATGLANYDSKGCDAIDLQGTLLSVRNVDFGNNWCDIYAIGDVHGVVVQDSSDRGNWANDYALAVIQNYSDLVIVNNSFTGASEQLNGSGQQAGHQPFIRFQPGGLAISGRILFANNVVEPSYCNNAALTFRPDSGDVGAIGTSSLGAPSPAPTSSYDAAGTTTISGGGAGFGGTGDQYAFLQTQENGNGTIVTHVSSLTGPSTAAAGLMWRYVALGNDGDSIAAGVTLTPGGTIKFQYRAAKDGTMTTVSVSSTDTWLEMVRSGNTFAAYHSPTGAAGTWVQVGTTQTLAMNTAAYVGLVEASGAQGTSATAVFSNSTLDGFGFGGRTEIYEYAVGNTVANGEMNFGYKGGNTPSYLNAYFVSDSNTVINGQMAFGNSGIHDIFRNNLVEQFVYTAANSDAFSNNSSNSLVITTGKGENDIWLVNNTFYTERTGSSAGVFTQSFGPYMQNVVLANNLVIAAANTSAGYTQELLVPASVGEFARISDNVWYNPTAVTENLVLLNGTKYTVANWNTTTGGRRSINGSLYADPSYDDQDQQGKTLVLGANYATAASATAVNIGKPLPGVWADMAGNLRTGSTWTVGAMPVEMITALKAISVTSSQINLTWTNISTTETGVVLQRATDAGFTVGLTSINLATNTTSYSDTGRTANTTYYYRVYVTTAGGNSAYSSTTSATTLNGGLFTSDLDIGTASPAGSYSYSAGTYTITGSGTDIWNNSDNFNYASETVTGDQTIIAKVTSISNTNTWAKAGVMLRDSTAANAMHVDMLATYGQGVSFQYRSATGGSSAFAQVSGVTNPVWVKLVRSGNNFSGYYSTNGTTWVQVGSTVSIPMNNVAQGGLAVTSHNNGALCTATFTNVSMYGALATDQDIGAPAHAGSANVDPSGTYTVAGGGADVWSTSDQFNYLSKSYSGDGVLIAKATSITNTQAWATAGVMFRSDTTVGSAFGEVALTPTSGVTFRYRLTAGGNVSQTVIGGLGAGTWVQLMRSGNSFSAYYSTDGTAWTQIGTTQTITMSTAIQAGLAVCAHDNTQLCTATFTNFSLGGLPAAPSYLTTNHYSPEQVRLAWVDNSSNEAGFVLQRATDAAFTAGLTTVNLGQGVTSYTDSSVVPGQIYYYRVQAVNKLGGSSYAITSTTTPIFGIFNHDADIGSPSPAGTSLYNNVNNTTTYTITAGGTDIGGTSDSFHLLSESYTGDGAIQAVVNSISNTSAAAKAGVMFRNTTAANSAFADVVLTPSSGVMFQYRTTAGGSTTAVTVAGITAPKWVRLVRGGNSFTAFYSSDGSTWTQIGSAVTISMGTTVEAGLAVTSNNNGTACTATFNSVSVFGVPAAPTNLAGTVISSSQINLTWTDNATNETGYVLERATDINFTVNVTDISLGVNATSYSNTGLSSGVTYYYRVKAVDVVGSSPWSAVVIKTTL